MANPGPGEANVTPDYSWDSTSKTTVEEGNAGGPPIIHPDVPVIFRIYTPEDFTVRSADYPKGVVILNENARPRHGNNITTVGNSDFNLIKGVSPQLVHIIDNVGWPCGVVVLW
jgi:hypothetical protein